MRVVGTDGSRHSIRPIGKSWPKYSEVEKSWKKEITKIRSEIRQGKRSIFDNATRIAFENIAKKHGINYSHDTKPRVRPPG